MFNDNDRLQQMEDNWNGQDIDKEYLDDYASRDSESMQERADEFRKDDSEPEPDFLEGIQVCRIDNEDCEVCQ